MTKSTNKDSFLVLFDGTKEPTEDVRLYRKNSLSQAELKIAARKKCILPVCELGALSKSLYNV